METLTQVKYADHEELWEEYYSSGRSVESRNALAMAYMPVLKRLAKRSMVRTQGHVGYYELVSAGMDGLLQAIARFNPDRGHRFTTYATPRICGAMSDWLRTQDHCKRMVRHKLNVIAEIRRQYSVSNCRDATDDELAEALNLTPRQLFQLLSHEYNDSLDFANASGSDGRVDTFSKHDTVADCVETPSDRIDRLEQMRHVLRGLTKQEKVLILSYYYTGETMKDIGQLVGLSESRVSQLHSELIVRLRDNLTPKPVSRESVVRDLHYLTLVQLGCVF